MSKLDEVAEKVTVSYSGDNYNIDPMTIIFIVGIIIDIVKMVMSCYSDSSEAVKKINNPSTLDKIILTNRIKKLAKNSDGDIDIATLKKALLTVNITDADFNELKLDVDRYRA